MADDSSGNVGSESFADEAEISKLPAFDMVIGGAILGAYEVSYV